METNNNKKIVYFLTALFALTCVGVTGYYFGSNSKKEEISSVTPTPTETAIPTPSVTAQLTVTPLPTGTTWKYFTSKNWSFAYPSEAKIIATDRYVSGECYDKNKVYVGCGTLTVDYKELRLEHTPCTECSPGNNYYFFQGKAVLVYGNYVDGIFRTLVEDTPQAGNKEISIAYTSFHNGSLFPISVVMVVPKADIGDYYAVADRMAISVFTTGREVTELPTPEFYPLAFSTINSVQIIDKQGNLVESLNAFNFGMLNGAGTYIALTPDKFYDLTSKNIVEIADSESLLNTDYNDMESSEWISDHEYLVRHSCDDDKVCPAGVLVDVTTKSSRGVQQSEIEKLPESVYKYTP